MMKINSLAISFGCW